MLYLAEYSGKLCALLRNSPYSRLGLTPGRYPPDTKQLGMKSLQRIKTDSLWVLAVIVAGSIVLPNYIVRELFAALLLFTVLFLLAGVLLGGAFGAWYAGKLFMGWGPLRNFATGVRRSTLDVWFKTPAA